MLLSLNVRCFRAPWMLTVRCSCGRVHSVPMLDLALAKLGDREERTLGNLVHRLRCRDCGGRPASVIAEHEPSREREELVASVS